MNARQLDNIPAELKQCPQWVCFRAVPDPTAHSGVKKIPVNPHTGGNASTNNPATWGSFKEAAAAMLTRGADGLGFVFAGSGFFGIDLDDIGDGADQLDRAEAAAIVDGLRSYTERSYSGNGVHVIARGSLPGKDLRSGKVEMYAGNRYFIMTGERLNAYGLRECTEAVRPIYDRYAATRATAAAADQSGAALCAQDPNGRGRSGLTDSEILEKAMKSPEFAALWAGDLTAHDNDHSKADNALAYRLAFWTGRDTVQADRLFRQSGLMRPKWDRPQSGSTYGAITLQRAADVQPETYSSRRPQDTAAAEARAMPGAVRSSTGDALESNPPEPISFETAADYVTGGGFDAAAAEYSRHDGLKTGFAQLDRALNGLFPGLYVLGALPGLGKTTLALQMADQISSSGRDVLYFSLEISKFDLVSKSFARIAAQQSGTKCLAGTTKTALDFRRRRCGDQLDSVRTEYARTAQRLAIIEGRKMSAQDVCSAVRAFIQQTGRRPVVVVDYLQLLAMRGADQRQSAKDYTDAATDALVCLAHECRLTVLAISSFNRTNYNESAGFAAFKESGLIESSADCVLALQLWAMHEKISAPTKDNDKRKRMPTAEECEKLKGHNPRELDLTVLKSRTGAVGAHIKLNYYTLCDLIEEADTHRDTAAAELAADQSGAGGEDDCRTV